MLPCVCATVWSENIVLVFLACQTALWIALIFSERNQVTVWEIWVPSSTESQLFHGFQMQHSPRYLTSRFRALDAKCRSAGSQTEQRFPGLGVVSVRSRRSFLWLANEKIRSSDLARFPNPVMQIWDDISFFLKKKRYPIYIIKMHNIRWEYWLSTRAIFRRDPNTLLVYTDPH